MLWLSWGYFNPFVFIFFSLVEIDCLVWPITYHHSNRWGEWGDAFSSTFKCGNPRCFLTKHSPTWQKFTGGRVGDSVCKYTSEGSAHPSLRYAQSCIWIKLINPLGKLGDSWSNHAFLGPFLEVISVSLVGWWAVTGSLGRWFVWFCFPCVYSHALQLLVGPSHVNTPPLCFLLGSAWPRKKSQVRMRIGHFLVSSH